jgi:inositol phosphorylceramide mannosyltransferase catalytic subunit
MRIPRIIHLTSKQKSKLPDSFVKNLEIMRDYYMEHDFCIYEDADIDKFVSTYDKKYYDQVFSHLPLQIMRVDAVRYLWMEAMGGIYFDFDIRLQKKWEPESGATLIEREWTWPKADDIKVSVHNCVLASAPGHPLWRRLLDGIAKQAARSAEASNKWPPVFDVTGPNAISRTITTERLTETLDNVHIMAPSTLYQRGFSRGSAEQALFIHQTAGSWSASGG